ncbi:hypothetical protein NYO91_14035 [Arhodomonas aquaeolei]|uniref:hypothetical protein n=1 Tax=Arhodomonas aquaeolei TaxID=2369 RepID=UPI002169D541|nr:hypothetical protein [Arhodomonas aquaeolei]MCS4505201.1 hypothetical protein [Arhodomonas aquaeolei]
MKNIQQIVEPEIQLVEDETLRVVLMRTYVEAAPMLDAIQRFFEEVAGQAWPSAARCQFFKNWRNPAIGAGSFCALTCRLLQEASLAERQSTRQSSLFQSAARIAEVSNEDMGLCGRNHAALYDDMATAFCGTDTWKLQRFSVPEATDYLTRAREYRERGEDMVQALMISLAEELYNHGEFTYIAPLFKKWYSLVLGLSAENRKRDLQFVFEHVGGTESGHFANMVEGLVHYCRAYDIAPDWEALSWCNRDYIHGIASSFEHLRQAMQQASEQPPSAAVNA